jgi:hypothetical protein
MIIKEFCCLKLTKIEDVQYNASLKQNKVFYNFNIKTKQKGF